VRLPAIADDATRLLPLPSFPLIARARFDRTDTEMSRQADAIAAKRRARTARQSQAIVSVPVFAGVKA
jgi:hypothetical protein